MHILRNFSVSLDMEYILERQGYKAPAKTRPEIMAALYYLQESIKELNLLQPSIVCESYLITRKCQDRFYLENGIELYGSTLSSVLSSAKKLAMAVCTIGPELEKAVAESFSKGEPLQGILLDGIGNLALDSVVREACRLTNNEALYCGWHVSIPIYPGTPALPISEQRTLFKMLPAEQIGVYLTSSGVMSPRKSVSLVMGMGSYLPARRHISSCDSCNLSSSCNYRHGPFSN